MRNTLRLWFCLLVAGYFICSAVYDYGIHRGILHQNVLRRQNEETSREKTVIQLSRLLEFMERRKLDGRRVERLRVVRNRLRR